MVCSFYILFKNYKLDKSLLLIVYQRLGYIYLLQSQSKDVIDKNLAKLAKSVYLQACEIKPNATSWLGAGRASFVLQELQEAEDAFAVFLFFFINLKFKFFNIGSKCIKQS